MKCLFLVLVLTGCATHINLSALDSVAMSVADQRCEPNGGVASIERELEDPVYQVTCINGAVSKITYKRTM